MTISQAKCPDTGNDSVPPNTEAMAALFFENGATADQTKVDKHGQPLNLKGKWHEYMVGSENCTKPFDIPRGENADPYNRYQGRYSSSLSGSSKAGGWFDSGLTRFGEWTEVVEEARALPHCHAVEQNILMNLRKQAYKMDGDPADDANKKPKGRSKKESKVELKLDVELNFDEDDMDF